MDGIARKSRASASKVRTGCATCKYGSTFRGISALTIVADSAVSNVTRPGHLVIAAQAPGASAKDTIALKLRLGAERRSRFTCRRSQRPVRMWTTITRSLLPASLDTSIRSFGVPLCCNSASARTPYTTRLPPFVRRTRPRSPWPWNRATPPSDVCPPRSERRRTPPSFHWSHVYCFHAESS